ncbi:MAG: hypothetical protein ACKVUS_07445 [Saprospiraceae bacterium]
MHHITTLNADAVPDGEVGSLRRCFQNADEQGLRWDEEIILNEPAQRRRLTIFNLIGFPMQAEGLATDQIYEPISGGKTRLTFAVFFQSPPSFWTTFKTFLGAWKIEDIFRQNMDNIKANIEKQQRK